MSQRQLQMICIPYKLVALLQVIRLAFHKWKRNGMINFVQVSVQNPSDLRRASSAVHLRNDYVSPVPFISSKQITRMKDVNRSSVPNLDIRSRQNKMLLIFWIEFGPLLGARLLADTTQNHVALLTLALVKIKNKHTLSVPTIVKFVMTGTMRN